jgi:ferric-dicitrate binding protein FerR (iron transport regulator)
MENEHYSFIISCLTDPGNAEKQHTLKQWLAASEANRALYEEVKMLWDVAGKLPAASLDQAAGWEALSQEITPVPAARSRKLPTRRWKAAAVVLPLLIAAGYLLYYMNQNSRVMHTARYEKDSLLLPDGTAVYLQQGARVSWISSFKERRVRLEAGEAFFNVAKDEQHSFSITAANATIKVLGTAFNVKTSADTTDVVVWDGKVSLDGSKHQPVILCPGEMGVVGAGEAYKKEGDHRYRCGWANDDLVFYNQPVSLVCRVLAAHYHLDGLKPNPALLNRNITVRFNRLDRDEALTVLAGVFDVELLKLQDTLSR